MTPKQHVLFDLPHMKLYDHVCNTCGRRYYVFRKLKEKDKPIEKCCVCRFDKPYVEEFITARFLSRG